MLATLSSLATLASSLVAASAEPTLSEIARAINADSSSTWSAYADGRFDNTTHEHVASRCGTWLPGHPSYVEMNITEPSHEELGLDPSLGVSDLPTDFDWRSQGKGCDDVISLVRDQSSCGSCWAMSASEAFTDRRCVTAKDTKIYSSMDVASCCHGFSCGMSMGCNGGQQGAALGWISKTGVVTGGNYEDVGTGKWCKDFSFPSCAHHVPASPGHPACPTTEYKTPTCAHTCSDSKYGTSYSQDKVKGSGSYAVRGESKIMQDLMTNGPQAVAFTVYTDFETYKSGVYKHKTGKVAGGHAVEFVGWGVEDTVPYWLVKNSWNPAWGDGGFFKIARGVGECGIEDSVYGVHIDV
jgi:cathepsin B